MLHYNKELAKMAVTSSRILSTHSLHVNRKTLFPVATLALSLIASPLVHADDSAHYGGTLNLQAQASAGTIDPMVNYEAEYWQLYASVYDGLVAFNKAGGKAGDKIVPDLATSLPQVSDNGKTYTFTLRKGIEFSNGQPVTLKDVVASFQRIFKVLSPTSGTFYNNIVGASQCLSTPASCTLKGGITTDSAKNTVTFHLVHSDPDFLYKLAAPHASILPASTPDHDVGNTPVAGTGSYMFKSYDPNSGLVLVRNPHFKQWSAEAQPKGYVDEIDYSFGNTQEASVNAIMNGQADWMYGNPPVDRLSELSTNAPSQLHLNVLNETYYLAMNNHQAPFNNLKVRQALNYAVDRNALVAIGGGSVLASPTCQILPPGMPGYKPFCQYTANPGEKWSAPDMKKAQALVDESGTKGQKITIVSNENQESVGIATYIQSVLNNLGYNASVQTLSNAIQFTYIQNTSNHVQLSVTDWLSDYPEPSDFLNVLFSCASYRKNSDSSINIAGFCQPSIDKQMQTAMNTSDQKSAEDQWSKIDRSIMEQAPIVPLFNPKQVDLVSKRLGNYTSSGMYQMLLSKVWVQ
ncbi:ABC transporter substrate-binding protein [Cernens ardua]|uniref:ABC transporter substrate-binding protein n=1 Tax=Cernens ardua TaxID=3402176 RepID=UPI003F9B8F98